jgi:hypothetical protein
MRLYTRQHKHYCGIGPHAQSMCVCVMNREREVLGTELASHRRHGNEAGERRVEKTLATIHSAPAPRANTGGVFT